MKNKAVINEDSSGSMQILKEEIKRLKLLLAKYKDAQINTIMIEDKLDFSSNHSETHSDVGEWLECVAECSPIKDNSTRDQFKQRILFLERLLMTHLENNANSSS